MPKGGRLWTPGRKLAGNLVPLLFFLPVASAGGFLFYRDGFTYPALAVFAASGIVGWWAINLFGLLGNPRLERQLRARLRAEDAPPVPGIFVGFARPSYRNGMDPHEDLGFLSWDEEQLSFLGETRRLNLKKSEIRAVDKRPNPHSWIGLGGWVAIHGEVEGKHVLMLVEPRIHRLLWKNRQERQKLIQELQVWAGVKGSAAKKAPKPKK